jgi:hypothetical protein
MTIGYALITFAIAALVFFAWKTISRARARRNDTELSQQLQSVDLEAFRNLTDPAEEQYLRDRLPPAKFRMIQRERLRAAIEYAGGVSHNASVLLSLGQTARQNRDLLIADAGRELVDEALRLRLYSVLTISKLWIRFLFPDTDFQPSPIVDRYQYVADGAIKLGRLQYPNRGGLLSRAP